MGKAVAVLLPAGILAAMLFWLSVSAAPAATPAARTRPAQYQPVTRLMRVLVTAYTAHDPGENGAGITASGTPARPGECAVDPAVIRLGARLYVPGYGRAVAEDTGGAIKGRHIDGFIPSRAAALAWGRRVETIIIIGGAGDANAE